jgi:hypothetical protein
VSKQRRRAITTPGDRIDPARRGPASIAVSVAIHIVAIAILIRVAIVPIEWIGFSKPEQPKAEHLTFVRTKAADTASARKPARSGGDGQKASANPAPALVVPQEVPSVLPPAPPKSATPAPTEGGSGPIIGGGGPTKGVMPAFTDPRIWAPTDPAPVRPKTQTEKLDSAIATQIHHLEDSLALAAGRAPGDWTWGKDGKKYGIDQKYIHLGNFSIPTALLALLPLNIQGNPTTYEAGKHFGQVRGEILEQSARKTRDEGEGGQRTSSSAAGQNHSLSCEP